MFQMFVNSIVYNIVNVETVSLSITPSPALSLVYPIKCEVNPSYANGDTDVMIDR